MASPYANSLQAPPKNDDMFTTKIQENQGELFMEFLNSDILGLSGVRVVRYFDGNTNHEVERHFRRALVTSMANNNKQIPETNVRLLPMRQRKLPASFWRQDFGSQSGQADMATNSSFHPGQYQNQCTMQWQSNGVSNPTGNQFQNSIPSNIIGPLQEGQSQVRYFNVSLVGNQPAVYSRLVSYSTLPVSVMSVPNVTITHAQMDSRPRCSISDAPAGYYTRGPTTGHGFNPRYNSLLVQPEVMLQLPLVYGQPREAGTRKG